MSAPAEEIVERSDHLADLRRYDDAIRVVQDGLAEFPDHTGLLCALVRTLVLSDRRDEALAASEAALRAGPEDAYAHRLRAHVLSVLGRHTEAIASARTAVTLDPNSPYSPGMLSLVLYQAGQLTEAYLEALRYVELAPDDDQAHFRVGLISGRRGHREVARQAYTEALRLNPEYAEARHNLALLDLNDGLTTRALGGLLAAGQLNPQLAVLIPNIVRVLWRLYWTLAGWLGLTALLLLALSNHPAAARGSMVLTLLGCGVIAWWQTRALPTGARAALRAAWLSDAALMTASGGLAVEAALFGAGLIISPLSAAKLILVVAVLGAALAYVAQLDVT